MQGQVSVRCVVLGVGWNMWMGSVYVGSSTLCLLAIFVYFVKLIITMMLMWVHARNVRREQQ